MGCDTARGLAAGLYQKTGATWRREHHDTIGVGPATRLARPATRPATGYDTAYDRATTLPAWAQCARPVRAAWVQGVHLVHPT